MEPRSDGMHPDGQRSTRVTRHSPKVTPRRSAETQANCTDDVGVNPFGVQDSDDRAAAHFDSAFTNWPEGEDRNWFHGAPSRSRAFDDDWAFFREALPAYDVKERIHYGGQGVVYQAVHRPTKRRVAIKVLLDGPLASQRQRHRLAREMELVGRLQQPNIVTLYEAGEVRGRPFLVMGFVEGIPIDDYVLLNDLSVRQIVGLFMCICRAVGSAHERGVIHRDIKPANILVDASGNPYVLDFGLARDVYACNDGGNGSIVSQSGHVVGTLPYLSPEQADGLNDQIDVRSDIYALGVVLHQLITGVFPYPVDGSLDTVRHNILSRAPIRLSKALGRSTCDRPGALRDINDDLEKVVLKALEKEKQHRYHSATSFADDLDRYLAGDAVEAKSASSFYVLRKSIRRVRWPLTFVFALATVVVSAAFFAVAERVRTNTIARLAESGLQMGGLIRLGSVHRDAGRLDRAIAMFEAATEISANLRGSDPAAIRCSYDAHHQLGNLYLDKHDPEKAERYVQVATELARGVLRKEPDNPEWVRLLGFSYRLQGRAAMARKQWEAALVAFNEAIPIREELLALEPDNRSLQSELASVCALRSQALRWVKRYDDAVKEATCAYDIYQELAQAEPAAEYELELARTETRLAVLHLCQRTAQDDDQATEWLQTAGDRLTRMQASAHGESHALPVRRILDSVRQNDELIRKRAAWRTENPD